MVIRLIALHWKEGWTKPQPEPTYSRKFVKCWKSITPTKQCLALSRCLALTSFTYTSSPPNLQNHTDISQCATGSPVFSSATNLLCNITSFFCNCTNKNNALYTTVTVIWAILCCLCLCQWRCAIQPEQDLTPGSASNWISSACFITTFKLLIKTPSGFLVFNLASSFYKHFLISSVEFLTLIGIFSHKILPLFVPTLKKWELNFRFVFHSCANSYDFSNTAVLACCAATCHSMCRNVFD